MDALSFDEETHTYKLDGLVVPGVTSILSPLSNFDAVPPAVLEAASQFGKAVHRACELDDQLELEEDDLDPALVPYLAAWRSFCEQHKVEWNEIESPVYHKTLRYAGTPDRIGLVDGVLTVVDIKTTAALYPSVGPQLAAYANAWKANTPMRRMAVQLKADGTYNDKTYTDTTDWPVFCSLLTLRNWCKRHSIKPTLERHS